MDSRLFKYEPLQYGCITCLVKKTSVYDIIQFPIIIVFRYNTQHTILIPHSSLFSSPLHAGGIAAQNY